MPFKSKKQMKWMFANKPIMAKEWAEKTTKINVGSKLRAGKKKYAAQGGASKTNEKRK